MTSGFPALFGRSPCWWSLDPTAGWMIPSSVFASRFLGSACEFIVSDARTRVKTVAIDVWPRPNIGASVTR